MSYSCCNNHKDIVNILETNLFGKNPYNVLQERYVQMRKRFLKGYQVGDKCAGYDIISGQDKKGRPLNDALLRVPLSDFSGCVSQFNCFNLGSDLPLWIEPENSKGRIMLVSQDPLRAGQGKGIITLSTPFGIHSPAYRNYGHHKTLTSIVESIVNQGYSVYLTDCHKLFGTKTKSVDKSCIPNQTTDTLILQEEIKFFSPCKVFALGRQAEAVLADPVLTKVLQHKPVYIPHPTGAHIKMGKGKKVEYFVNLIISAMP